MKYDTEKNGIHKIVKYQQEVYCLHYKGKPFSVSKLSYQCTPRGIKIAGNGGSIDELEQAEEITWTNQHINILICFQKPIQISFNRLL